MSAPMASGMNLPTSSFRSQALASRVMISTILRRDLPDLARLRVRRLLHLRAGILHEHVGAGCQPPALQASPAAGNPVY